MTDMILKTENGADIYYLRSDKFKKTTVSVNIYRPIENEASENALLARVMKATCKKYPEKSELEKYLEWMYGAVFNAGIRKKGEMQVIYFEISVPSDRYTGENTTLKAAKFLKEIVYNPNFDENVVAVEKENLKNIISAAENDKREYATQRCIEEMFPSQPFSQFRYGSVYGVSKISARKLEAHYENIINSSCIDIFVAGECNIDEIKEVFDCVKSVDNIIKCEKAKKRTAVKEIHELMDVNQGKLVIGMTVDAPYADTVVMNSVFGSGTHSKLFNNVREKLSLAYYAYSRYTRSKEFLLIGTGIEFDKFESAKNEIMHQLSEVQNGNISEFEMEAAKKFIKNMYVSMEDDRAALIDFYISQKIAGDSSSISDFIKDINAVTSDAVISAAKTVKTDTIYFLKGTD